MNLGTTYAICGQLSALALSAKAVQLLLALAKLVMTGLMPFMKLIGIIYKRSVRLLNGIEGFGNAHIYFSI